MGTASRSLDGLSFESYRARYNGSVDLEEEEAQKLALGETVVMVVVCTVADVQARTVKGEISRVAVCKVTDARVVDGELQNSLVTGLGLYGEDTMVDVPPAADPETGEVVRTNLLDGVDFVECPCPCHGQRSRPTERVHPEWRRCRASGPRGRLRGRRWPSQWGWSVLAF
jgi:hypothetical protein